MTNYSQYAERDLLLLLKEGDSSAFNELYERTWYALYRAAYARLKDREACKDIVHDVFADLWNKRQSKAIDALLPYLQAAVRYKIYTLIARGHSARHFTEPFENMATSTLQADSWFQFNELENLVNLWIAALPEKRRKIFTLKYKDDLTTREIGAQLNVSQKTVQNQLLNAYNDLQGHLRHHLTLLFIFHFLL